MTNKKIQSDVRKSYLAAFQEGVEEALMDQAYDAGLEDAALVLRHLETCHDRNGSFDLLTIENLLTEIKKGEVKTS